MVQTLNERARTCYGSGSYVVTRGRTPFSAYTERPNTGLITFNGVLYTFQNTIVHGHTTSDFRYIKKRDLPSIRGRPHYRRASSAMRPPYRRASPVKRTRNSRRRLFRGHTTGKPRVRQFCTFSTTGNHGQKKSLNSTRDTDVIQTGKPV